MKTLRVMLTAEEVSEALVRFAYHKSGRTAWVTTGKIEVMTVFGQLPDGVTFIEQARVEMDLPE